MTTAAEATLRGQGSKRRFLSQNTLAASVVRLGLSMVVAPPTAFLAIMALGSGSLPLGIVIAVPFLALVWFWLADLVAVAQRRYRERPSYAWWLAGCVALCCLWAAWALSNEQIHWGTRSAVSQHAARS